MLRGYAKFLLTKEAERFSTSITCLLNLRHISGIQENYNLSETVYISEVVVKFSNGSVKKKKEKKSYQFRNSQAKKTAIFST